MIASEAGEEMDLYDRIGVRKLIKAHGTLTSLGGSRMPAQVVELMAQAARHFVDLEDLLLKSGEYVADLIDT